MTRKTNDWGTNRSTDDRLKQDSKIVGTPTLLKIVKEYKIGSFSQIQGRSAR